MNKNKILDRSFVRLRKKLKNYGIVIAIIEKNTNKANAISNMPAIDQIDFMKALADDMEIKTNTPPETENFDPYINSLNKYLK